MKTEVLAPYSVLFDLDGTLLDTAPDLAAALNQVLVEEGRTARSFEDIRPVVSHGGIALIRFGFEIEPSHPDFERLRLRFLEIYRQHIAENTRPFPGMNELLDHLEQNNIPWGVVTNKPSWLTDPLLAALGLNKRAATIVSGDTTANAKPHPEPMYYACEQTGHDPQHCIYVGDAERDIEAGRRAGMKTLVALFGYIGDEDRPEQWQADGMIRHPLEILEFIRRWKSAA
ncbi:MAG: phosphoglycolate phosphatase [Pseudomonadota bacterium]